MEKKKCPNCGAEMVEVEELGFSWSKCSKSCMGDLNVLVSPKKENIKSVASVART